MEKFHELAASGLLLVARQRSLGRRRRRRHLAGDYHPRDVGRSVLRQRGWRNDAKRDLVERSLQPATVAPDLRFPRLLRRLTGDSALGRLAGLEPSERIARGVAIEARHSPSPSAQGFQSV